MSDLEYDRHVFSAGFAAPILWGIKQGIATVEIADGLELELCIVEAVLESRRLERHCQGVRFWRTDAAPVIAPRTDAAYRAWSRARRGAVMTLRELAGSPAG